MLDKLKRNKFLISYSIFSLWLALIVFKYTKNAGIHADDAGFYKFYLTSNFTERYQQFLDYVPGRNLHVVWQNIAYFLTNWTDGNFVPYHGLMALTLGINAFLIGLMLKTLNVRNYLIFSITPLSIFWPSFFEATIWPSALPMHIFSATLILTLILLILKSLDSKLTLHSVILIELIYLLAVFTYDQAMTSSTLVMLAWITWLTIENFKGNRLASKSILISLYISMISIFTFYKYLVLDLRPGSAGPTAHPGMFKAVVQNFIIWIKQAGLTYGPFLEESFNPTRLFRLTIVGVILLSALNVLLPYLTNLTNVANRSPELEKKFVIFVIFVGSAAAAYSPSWAWSVSSRHTYLPTILMLVAIGIIFEISLKSVADFPSKLFSVGLMAVLLISSALGIKTFKNSASKWLDRENIRMASYQSIEQAVRGSGFSDSSCIRIVDVTAPDGSTPFYSEAMNYALDIYAGVPSKENSCQGWNLIAFDEKRECAEDSAYDPNVETAYLKFGKDELGNPDWTKVVTVPVCASEN